jgi:SM-20-related protein
VLSLTDDEVAALGRGGYVLRDGWLGAPAAAELHRQALSLVDELRPARIRGAGAPTRRAAVRGDDVMWIDPPLLSPLRDGLAALREELNRAAYLGLSGFELQLARYRPGAAYARHLDAFAEAADSRRATANYYLNPGWEPERGGALRLHTADGPVDLEPRLDRLIVFLSTRVEHEVRPASVPRLAATAWFYGAAWRPGPRTAPVT